MVVPDFPAGASAGADGVRIDVTGTVLRSGELQFERMDVPQGQARFGEAVAQVLRWWRFVPAIDRAQCAPVDTPTTMSVWFQGTSEAPRVFVSYPTSEQPRPRPLDVDITGPAVRADGWDGRVEGMVRVLLWTTPEGRIVTAAVRASTPYGHFDAPVLESARQMRVAWRGPAPIAEICAEREYLFCARRAGDARIRFDGCRGAR